MFSQELLPKRRFGPFLLEHLESGNFPNLQWDHKENKLFYILWQDNRSRTIPSEGDLLFKKWEMYNKRFTEGMEEQWAKWKQTFNNALMRCPDVKKVEKLWKKVDESTMKRVYQFGDAINTNIGKWSCKTRATSKFLQNQKEPSRSRDDPINTNRGSVGFNIPTVVTDDTNETDDGNSNSSDEASTKTTSNGLHHNFSQTLGFVAPETIFQNQNHQLNIDHSHPSSNTDCPQKFSLDSDEFADLFESCTSSMGSLHLSDIPDFLVEEERPFARFQLFYSNCPVLKGSLNETNCGLRLFYGMNYELDVPADLFGPKDFKQEQLPDITTCNDENKIENIRSILEKMKRGLLLYCRPQEKKMYALRLCATRIFAWNNTDGSIVLNRKNKMYQQLFDMKNFEKMLELFKSSPEKHSCPSPSVILTFAQEYSQENIINQKQLMHLVLTFVEAEELLRRELVLVNDQDSLQFSGLDSGDVLLEHIQNLINDSNT